MSLKDTDISHEKDGALNEKYCKWCYSDGDFTMDFWKQYADIGGKEKFVEFKQQLINEFNTLFHIEGLPKVENLNVLPGDYINLKYTLPNGHKVKLLDDNASYLGNQLECEFGGERCLCEDIRCQNLFCNRQRNRATAGCLSSPRNYGII